MRCCTERACAHAQTHSRQIGCKRSIKIVERSLWVGGAFLVALYFLDSAWGESARQQGVGSFAQHKRKSTGTVHSASSALTHADAGSSSAATLSTPPSSLPQ